MNEKRFQKIVVIVVFFSVFFGTMVSVMSSLNDSEIDAVCPCDNQKYCITCDMNFFEEPGYPPRYVMGLIPPSPAEEESSKPTVLRDLPSEFSWMNYNGADWTTPAKDQANCGSCWAFGAVSCLESRMNIAWYNPTLDIDTSEQYILSGLSSSGGCNGGNSFSAFKCIKSEAAYGNYHNGIIPEECLIYSADDTVSCSDKCEDGEEKLIPISISSFGILGIRS